MNYQEKELAVMEYLVYHSIYNGHQVRATKAEIAEGTELSLYMVTKIIKKLVNDGLIYSSHIRYKTFYVWGKERKKPIHTEYHIDKDRIYDILGYDQKYDPQHVTYHIEDFSGLPITHHVNKAETTASVYVTYTNTQNWKTATVRFSDHSPASWVPINKYAQSREDILRRLGIAA